MQKLIKYLGYLDFAGAAGSLAWGATHRSVLWIAFGLLGFLFAWWSPARRINNLAQRKFLARRHVPAVAVDANDAELSPNAPAVPFYGYRTDLPFARGGKVFRFNGVDSYLRYALYIGARYATKR